MTRSKELILSLIPSSTDILSLTQLEVQIDIRDTLQRIATALEPSITNAPAKTRKNAWEGKEKLQCPLCFVKYKNIKLHMLRKHNMTLTEAMQITTKPN